jgi:outer membrane protein assembly factor BamD (BamD/ComL family)
LARLRFRWLAVAWAVVALGAAADARAQSKSARPALIRDTDVAEGKDEAEANAPKPYNPMLAEKNVKVGRFYLKQGNYKAAIERFKEALEYQPSRVEAYAALGQAYEKNKDWDKALLLYRNFLGKYPASPKAVEFRSRIGRIEKR